MAFNAISEHLGTRTQRDAFQHGVYMSQKYPQENASPVTCVTEENVKPASHRVLVLQQALQMRLDQSVMRDVDLSAVSQCIRELELAVMQLGPQWRVQPFGSVANGFGVRGSDVDATCYLVGTQSPNMRTAASELQTRLLPLLNNHPKFEVVDLIWNARVPIVKLKFDTLLDVDLSCHNTEALSNTRLLRAYAELAPQVRELGVLVKLWAKGEGVCGASRGYLSSYSLTLMAIYFLQVDPSVRMPCLPTEAFDGCGTPSVRVAWRCALSTASLLARFLAFFSAHFQWGTEVVCVRRGQRATTDDLAFAQLGSRSSQRLHIEDPFLRSRNLNGVLGLEEEGIFRTKLRGGAEALRDCRVPASLGCGVLVAGTGPRKKDKQTPLTLHKSETMFSNSSTTTGPDSVPCNGCALARTNHVDAHKDVGSLRELIIRMMGSEASTKACSTDSGSDGASCASDLQGVPKNATPKSFGAESQELDLEHRFLPPRRTMTATEVWLSAAESPSPDEVPITLLERSWHL